MSRSDFAAELIVRPGSRPRLHDRDANGTFDWNEEDAVRALKMNRQRLEELQFKLFADRRFALLIVLQGIDGAGKDGTCRHVITAFNPQGCTGTSFKAPTPEELRHDYLWRIHQHAPARGEVSVFNRSHYEDVLIARVDKLAPPATLHRRYDQINAFEHFLCENDTLIVKFFLQISRDEQKQRFAERLRDPAKQWKLDPADLDKRKQWKAYQQAFEAMLYRCSTEHAPWYRIPSDRKWFRNLAVSQILLQALASLPLRFPKPAYNPRKLRIP